MTSPFLPGAVLSILAFSTACAGLRPSAIPTEPDFLVAVKSARLPEEHPELLQFAHHSWIDVKDGGEESWRRYEVLSRFTGARVTAIDAAEARKDVRFGREIHLLELLTGPEASSVLAGLEAAAAAYEDGRPDDYRTWPGPNSNTYIARLGRRTPGLAFELHHNAAAKDYAEILRLGGTTTKTGLALDTPVLGFAIGLREGVELHISQLTFGISLFPPALKLPVLPRLGFGP